MKKALWIISCIPLAATAIALQFMAARVPMHYDAAGNIDRWGSKYEMLILPATVLALALLSTLLTAHFERKATKAAGEKERAGVLSNARVLGIAGIAAAAVFAALQLFLLYAAYKGAGSETAQPAVDIGRVSCVLLGILFIILGNYMPKTRANRVFGIRVPWSMYNDTTWRKSNRFGGYVLIAAGIATVIEAAVIPDPFGAVMVMLALLITAAAAALLYARRAYNGETAGRR